MKEKETTTKKIEDLFNSFQDIRVAVLGDVMLDSYLWGQVERISPEAPVPIVHIQREELRLGGAANVALNLAALGAKVDLLSVVGDDDYGQSLRQLLHQQGIGYEHILSTSSRPTTRKTRIMARNQQVMRLDNEVVDDLESELENRLLERISSYFQKDRPQLLILEDYNKGVLTPKIIQSVLQMARAQSMITAVDPKNENFFLYKNVTIFKPNLGEIKAALQLNHLKDININTLSEMHTALYQQLAHQYSLFTLSEKGVFYQKSNQSPELIAAKIRKIADVSGAGDTVIAVIGLVYAVTTDMSLAAQLGNIAGGLVCEQVGTAAIDKDLLHQEALKHL